MAKYVRCMRVPGVLKGRAMSVRLFVGNLPYETTEPDLREFFSTIGPLSNVIIPVDRETGKRRGFAFVEFSEPAQAEEASRRLNNQPFKGRNITINEARARESRPDSGAGPRPGFSMRPAGVGGASRPSFMPRPSFGGQDFTQNPMENGRAGRSERRNRNFGPDAKPARKRRPNYGAKGGGEMGGKKGPLRERVGGQFFGDYEDDDLNNNDDQDLDLMSYSTDSDEEGAV
jgi:cold-inducible RNA-binding protein